jgi:hypothetical protein
MGKHGRLWMGTVAQFALIILLGVGVAESTVAGRHLLVGGAIWFLAALAWHILGPSSFFWSFGKRNRVIAMTITYTFFFLFQLLMFWVAHPTRCRAISCRDAITR